MNLELICKSGLQLLSSAQPFANGIVKIAVDFDLLSVIGQVEQNLSVNLNKPS